MKDICDWNAVINNIINYIVFSVCMSCIWSKSSWFCQAIM